MITNYIDIYLDIKLFLNKTTINALIYLNKFLTKNKKKNKRLFINC